MSLARGPRPHAGAAGLVLATVAGMSAAAGSDVPHVRRGPVCACVATHHPDTADTSGPYRVSLRELTGALIVEGVVRYVADGDGARRRGEVALRRAGDAWVAGIPGQPAGSTVRYHFVLDAADGVTCRHPARVPAGYRFDVVPLEVVSVAVPLVAPPGGEPPAVTLVVRSPAAVSGAVHVRLLPPPEAGPRDLRVPLVVLKGSGERGPPAWTLEARLPALAPGRLADLHFELSTAAGATLRVPADAPSRTYTIRGQLTKIESLPTEPGLVLDVAAEDHFEAVATKGGGASWRLGASKPVSWGLARGLGSDVARFVRHDPAAARIYVGTDRGVVAVESAGEAWLDVVAPQPSPTLKEVEDLARLGAPRRAGPAALSTLDGTLRFQVQGVPTRGSSSEDTVFLALRDDVLEAWDPALPGASFAGLSTLAFDPVDGCWLAGGWVWEEGAGLGPAVLRDCEGEVEGFRLLPVGLGQARAVPDRVVAIARDPASSDAVLGLEIALESEGHRRRDFGVYRASWSQPALVPLTRELGAVGAEVTSLASDWRNGRVLVGTVGKGVLQVRGGSSSPVAPEGLLSREVTALSVKPSDGSLLVGTARGAFRVTAEGGTVGMSEEGGWRPLPVDALPTDVDSATGRVLLASYGGGLFQLERDEAGGWRVGESFRPGRELPAGLLGEARYGPDGAIWAIAYGLGVLRVADGRVDVIGREHGLRGTNLIRILALPTGEVWVAHSPVPFGPGTGGRIQRIEGGRVTHTQEIGDRELATITRWIEVPERGAIWAATMAGVVEMKPDGSMSLLSRNAASSIVRGPAGGSIGVVGATIERWDGKHFVPVLFRADHPRWPGKQAPKGPPLDLAIDGSGNWFVLFRGGVVAWLDSGGRLVGTLDPRDGISPSAERIIAHPQSGGLVVGSSAGGAAIVHPAPGVGGRPRVEEVPPDAVRYTSRLATSRDSLPSGTGSRARGRDRGDPLTPPAARALRTDRAGPLAPGDPERRRSPPAP